MAKYLLHGSYTLEGVKGLIKEGGSSRRSHFEQNVKKAGGKVEAFYYAFGENDIYSIVDIPDNINTTAVSLAINAGGGFKSNVIVLLTPEEIDEAGKRASSVGYRPPGK